MKTLDTQISSSTRPVRVHKNTCRILNSGGGQRPPAEPRTAVTITYHTAAAPMA